MKTFEEALKEGFTFIGDTTPDALDTVFRQIHPQATHQHGYWSFKFGDGWNKVPDAFLPEETQSSLTNAGRSYAHNAPKI